MIYILGIHDGHNSGATLLCDGKILASISEERLSRVKNEVGYPRQSIDEVLKIAGIGVEKLNKVVYASSYMHTAEHLRNATEWYKAGDAEQSKDVVISAERLKANFDKRRQERICQVVDHLGVSVDQITFVDHHLAHAAAAYYGSPFSFEQPVLILTCDGAGDGLSSTVSIGRGAHIERIASTGRDASLGKIYSRVTYSLGLTPWEHEYKVMGLAPYAELKRVVPLSKIFRELVVLDENKLIYKLAGDTQTSYTYDFLKKRLERQRFDEISGAVQMYTEEMLCEWVKGCVAQTGIRRIVCGGGVFMNVKANLRISELDEIDEMFVFPSCGDESLSFGAVWLEYYASLAQEKSNEAALKKEFLNDIYLGGEFSEDQIKLAIDSELAGSNCTIGHFENIEEIIAERLADNKIVARFAGRMEFGARALGNRSILANPKEWKNVEKINSMIKMRDFWMPFAPSMIKEKQSSYLINPKNITSPYMMFAYETLPLASEHLGAAIHPRDKTARAQFVDRGQNLKYWSLLQSFEAKTGISAVLNTSFNLHGYPLVYTPQDAIMVFLNSGLDCLALENYLITKKIN